MESLLLSRKLKTLLFSFVSEENSNNYFSKDIFEFLPLFLANGKINSEKASFFIDLLTSLIAGVFVGKYFISNLKKNVKTNLNDKNCGPRLFHSLCHINVESGICQKKWITKLV